MLAAATWFAVDGRGAGDSADPPRGSGGTTASVPSSTSAPAPPAGLLTVDLATGETKFYEDYDGFLEGRDEYKAYCETSDRC